ncbi:sodium- and chloride-dependent creatine transporter 1-like [Argopecten irradians]|uniref:sodium- and chloride-dependent creatine transporter 1-like n=1 Tax=Argopecten irradians TaxID=31199 RepID=UPI003717DB40
MGGFRFENVYNFPSCSGKEEIPEGEAPQWRCRKKRKAMAQQQEEVEKLRLSTVEETDCHDDQQDYQRGTWTRKCDFLLSIVGYSVGVSNIWRFPYLCMRNGGGAFLIPFFFFLIFCGIPLFFMELCLGQFSGVSSLFVWSLCPLFKGLGYLMVIVSFLMSWYYIMVLVWVIYYLVNSFYDPLPWSVCTNPWNTPFCIEERGQMNTNRTIQNNWTSLETNSSEFMVSNFTFNASVANFTPVTAAKEFWQLNVLQISSGFGDMGGIRWHLVLALAVAWVLVFLCLMKGVKSVGKVVYVTALLPYLLLTIFLVRGLLLPGAVDGIIFYLSPDFRRLLDYQFGTFETVSSGLVDAFPRLLGKRKVLLTAALSMVLFLLGLPFTTNEVVSAHGTFTT